MTNPSQTTESSVGSGTTELLSFRVGGQDYCIDIMSVREIRGGTRATPLPHAPRYMRGVVNLRGTVLPIMDLSCRLELDTALDQDRKAIIVVADAARTIGLLVDAVCDILAVPNADLQPPPDLKADGARTFISALMIVEDRMIRVLDLQAILPPRREDAA